MTFYAYLSVILVSSMVGFSVGINLRDNPPKRARKPRKLKALETEATGENK